MGNRSTIMLEKAEITEIQKESGCKLHSDDFGKNFAVFYNFFILLSFQKKSNFAI